MNGAARRVGVAMAEDTQARLRVATGYRAPCSVERRLCLRSEVAVQTTRRRGSMIHGNGGHAMRRWGEFSLESHANSMNKYAMKDSVHRTLTPDGDSLHFGLIEASKVDGSSDFQVIEIVKRGLFTHKIYQSGPRYVLTHRVGANYILFESRHELNKYLVGGTTYFRVHSILDDGTIVSCFELKPAEINSMMTNARKLEIETGDMHILHQLQDGSIALLWERVSGLFQGLWFKNFTDYVSYKKCVW